MDRAVLLRFGAAAATALVFVGASDYTLHHPKNPLAPLQPPASEDLVLRETAAPSGASRATPPPSSTPRRGATATPAPRVSGTPVPRVTLQPGVRATELPGVTYTHVS